ncbi:MAG: rhomboid family intramembrane serine protease [Verrucomicrobia bacterium]|nr:rhomboid family intramembrane serine protease [Verrucomicrobiota bacterium]
MSQLEPATTALDDAMPTDLVEVGVYATGKEAFDHGLVVLALGRPYWLVEAPGGHRLLVEAEVAERVRVQLSRFDRERLRWPPKPLPLGTMTYATDLITPLLWAVAVLAVFSLQGTHPAWAEAGAVDAAAIFDRGEWWRIGTALWLHADGAHVISNALSGLLLFTAVVKTLGRLRGWLLVMAAAGLGNLAVAALAYPGPYRSLGASTAIFAGLGLLTGRMLRVLSRAEHPHRWRAMLVTLGSGVVVLALYGAGGGAAHVDIGAHVAGFLAGLALGFAAGRIRGEASAAG